MKKLRLFLLFTILISVAGYRLYLIKNPNIKLANKTVQVTAILYSDLTNPQLLEQVTNSFQCQSESCVSPIIKRILESEFKRYTGEKTNVELTVIPPLDSSLFDVNFPSTGIEKFKFVYNLYNEFKKRGASYFKSDIRMYINVSNYDPNKYEEVSLGSSNLRAGFVQWDVGKYKNIYMWNITKFIHEIGHVLGASDKYKEGSISVFPQGYVDPSKGPNSKQDFVEIMSGTRPTGEKQEAEATRPMHLKFGSVSAAEMGWLSHL